MTEDQLEQYAILCARYAEAATHCATIVDAMNWQHPDSTEFLTLMPAYLEAWTAEQAAGQAITAYARRLQSEGALV